MFRMSVKRVLGQGYSIVMLLMKSLVINHTKSSESIAKDAAIFLFQGSVEGHLKYTFYVGDGDSLSFKVLRKTMKKTRGDSYCIEKGLHRPHPEVRIGSNF